MFQRTSRGSTSSPIPCCRQVAISEELDDLNSVFFHSRHWHLLPQVQVMCRTSVRHNVRLTVISQIVPRLQHVSCIVAHKAAHLAGKLLLSRELLLKLHHASTQKCGCSQTCQQLLLWNSGLSRSNRYTNYQFVVDIATFVHSHGHGFSSKLVFAVTEHRGVDFIKKLSPHIIACWQSVSWSK